MSNYEDIPLANANVYGILLVFYVDQNTAGLDLFISSSITDISGKAIVEFKYDESITKHEDYAFLYITYVDFYGLRSYSIISPSHIETPLLVVPYNEGIACLYNSSVLPSGAVHMRGVYGISLPRTASGNVEIYKIWVRMKKDEEAESPYIINHGSNNYTYYSLKGVEQKINAIGIGFKYTGRFHLYLYSLSEIINDELRYGSSASPGGKKTIVVAKRLVRIEGMDYVFEFRMWRMAED